jgi:hypothetical protein
VTAHAVHYSHDAFGDPSGRVRDGCESGVARSHGAPAQSPAYARGDTKTVPRRGPAFTPPARPEKPKNLRPLDLT